MRIIIQFFLILLMSTSELAIALTALIQKDASQLSCVKAPDHLSLSDWIEYIEKAKETKCKLNTGGFSVVYGYFYKCNNKMSQMLFRTDDHCEYFKKHINDKSVDYKYFLPKDLSESKKDQYSVAFMSCVEKGSEGVMPIQDLYKYCDCTVRKLPRLDQNKKLSNKRMIEIMAPITKECMSDLKK